MAGVNCHASAHAAGPLGFEMFVFLFAVWLFVSCGKLNLAQSFGA